MCSAPKPPKQQPVPPPPEPANLVLDPQRRSRRRRGVRGPGEGRRALRVDLAGFDTTSGPTSGLRIPLPSGS